MEGQEAYRTPFLQLHKYQEEILTEYPTSEPATEFWMNFYSTIQRMNQNAN